ncbi:hypothetical protein ACO1O0_007320 [Amphichorda felina]
MKISAVFYVAAAMAPLADATCNYQSTGFLQKKWRLSTYKSKNCINKTGDWSKSGFGVKCVNIPNNTRSFIFSVGSGYGVGQQCSIFFKTTDKCGGDTVGRSNGKWKKSSLSAKGKKMKSAYVQCTKLLKRDGEDGDVEYEDEEDEYGVEDVGDYLQDRAFILGDDDEWYEELPDGTLVKAEEAAEDLEYVDVPETIEAEA